MRETRDFVANFHFVLGSAFESGDEITKQSGSDSSNMSSDRPSQDKSDEQNNNSKRNTSTSKTGSTNCSSVTSCSTPSSVTTSRSPSSSGEEKVSALLVVFLLTTKITHLNMKAVSIDMLVSLPSHVVLNPLYHSNSSSDTKPFDCLIPVRM